MTIIRFMAAVILAAISLTAYAEENGCPRYSAPGKFKNIPSLWGKTDTGVITDGFIDLLHQDEKIFEVLHGADLSHHNQVNYQRMKECGGVFSFVKVDPMFDAHARALKKQGITLLPYVYFKIPEPLRQSKGYSDAGEGSDKLAGIIARFEKKGAEEAALFIGNVGRMAPALDAVDIGGIRGRIVGVDIEEKLLDEKASTDEQRVAYGRGYARALCTWVTQVKKPFPDLIVFIYTTPSVYGDYLRYALPIDNACINGLPVWLSHTTGDAGDSLYSSARRAASKSSDAFAQRLCDLAGGNRCVVHQYSHRALFAAQGKTSKNGEPPHHDVDRWFPIKVINTPSGDQYIRRDSLVRPVGKGGIKVASSSKAAAH